MQSLLAAGQAAHRAGGHGRASDTHGQPSQNAPEFFRIYHVNRPMPDLAIVADSFHLKPLLRTLQSAGDYQVLSLSRDSVALYEGNHYGLVPVQLHPAVPRVSADALRTDNSNILDSDAEKFLRALDRGLIEHHSHPGAGVPIILAALPENEAIFRKVSHNPQLLPTGLGASAETMPIEELSQRAWQLVEPLYLERLAGLVDTFGASEARGQAEGDLAGVARAACEGRVATLLVEAERHIPGCMDGATGRIEFDELANPEVDDLLDDVAELVMKGCGEVVVVPAEQMPTRSGLAAIYRY